MTISALTDASNTLREAWSVASRHGGDSPVEVSFDLTALIMVGLFIVLMLVLKPLLFDPMLKLFEEREKRILGAKLQARKLDEESAGALTKYESEMQHARSAGIGERDKLRAEGVKTENEILANGWLSCPADAGLIFDPDFDHKYDRALAILGVDEGMLSSDAGHA